MPSTRRSAAGKILAKSTAANVGAGSKKPTIPDTTPPDSPSETALRGPVNSYSPVLEKSMDNIYEYHMAIDDMGVQHSPIFSPEVSSNQALLAPETSAESQNLSARRNLISYQKTDPSRYPPLDGHRFDYGNISGAVFASPSQNKTVAEIPIDIHNNSGSASIADEKKKLRDNKSFPDIFKSKRSASRPAVQNTNAGNILNTVPSSPESLQQPIMWLCPEAIDSTASHNFPNQPSKSPIADAPQTGVSSHLAEQPRRAESPVHVRNEFYKPPSTRRTFQNTIHRDSDPMETGSTNTMQEHVAAITPSALFANNSTSRPNSQPPTLGYIPRTNKSPRGQNSSSTPAPGIRTRASTRFTTDEDHSYKERESSEGTSPLKGNEEDEVIIVVGSPPLSFHPSRPHRDVAENPSDPVDLLDQSRPKRPRAVKINESTGGIGPMTSVTGVALPFNTLTEQIGATVATQTTEAEKKEAPSAQAMSLVAGRIPRTAASKAKDFIHAFATSGRRSESTDTAVASLRPIIDQKKPPETSLPSRRGAPRRKSLPPSTGGRKSPPPSIGSRRSTRLVSKEINPPGLVGGVDTDPTSGDSPIIRRSQKINPRGKYDMSQMHHQDSSGNLIGGLNSSGKNLTVVFKVSPEFLATLTTPITAPGVDMEFTRENGDYSQIFPKVENLGEAENLLEPLNVVPDEDDNAVVHGEIYHEQMVTEPEGLDLVSNLMDLPNVLPKENNNDFTDGLVDQNYTSSYLSAIGNPINSPTILKKDTAVVNEKTVGHNEFPAESGTLGPAENFVKLPAAIFNGIKDVSIPETADNTHMSTEGEGFVQAENTVELSTVVLDGNKNVSIYNTADSNQSPDKDEGLDASGNSVGRSTALPKKDTNVVMANTDDNRIPIRADSLGEAGSLVEVPNVLPQGDDDFLMEEATGYSHIPTKIGILIQAENTMETPTVVLDENNNVSIDNTAEINQFSDQSEELGATDNLVVSPILKPKEGRDSLIDKTNDRNRKNEEDSSFIPMKIPAQIHAVLGNQIDMIPMDGKVDRNYIPTAAGNLEIAKTLLNFSGTRCVASNPLPSRKAVAEFSCPICSRTLEEMRRIRNSCRTPLPAILDDDLISQHVELCLDYHEDMGNTDADEETLSQSIAEQDSDSDSDGFGSLWEDWEKQPGEKITKTVLPSHIKVNGELEATFFKPLSSPDEWKAILANPNLTKAQRLAVQETVVFSMLAAQVEFFKLRGLLEKKRAAELLPKLPAAKKSKTNKHYRQIQWTPFEPEDKVVYEDKKEAALYNFEYDPSPHKRGSQDPLTQRYSVRTSARMRSQAEPKIMPGYEYAPLAQVEPKLTRSRGNAQPATAGTITISRPSTSRRASPAIRPGEPARRGPGRPRKDGTNVAIVRASALVPASAPPAATIPAMASAPKPTPSSTLASIRVPLSASTSPAPPRATAKSLVTIPPPEMLSSSEFFPKKVIKIKFGNQGRESMRGILSREATPSFSALAGSIPATDNDDHAVSRRPRGRPRGRPRKGLMFVAGISPQLPRPPPYFPHHPLHNHLPVQPTSHHPLQLHQPVPTTPSSAWYPLPPNLPPPLPHSPKPLPHHHPHPQQQPHPPLGHTSPQPPPTRITLRIPGAALSRASGSNPSPVSNHPSPTDRKATREEEFRSVQNTNLGKRKRTRSVRISSDGFEEFGSGPPAKRHLEWSSSSDEADDEVEKDRI